MTPTQLRQARLFSTLQAFMAHLSAALSCFILLVFSPQIANAVTPAKPPNGGVADGYYGNLPAVPGDYLLATNCHCERAPPLLEIDADLGTYTQYEYYNYHVRPFIGCIASISGIS